MCTANQNQEIRKALFPSYSEICLVPGLDVDFLASALVPCGYSDFCEFHKKQKNRSTEFFIKERDRVISLAHIIERSFSEGYILCLKRATKDLTSTVKQINGTKK